MKSMLRWLKWGPKTHASNPPEEDQPDSDTADGTTSDEEGKNEELWFPSWPPPNPKEILADRVAYRHRLRFRRYRAPEYVFEDSPLFGLYRLYEWIMADHVINMRNELETFWYVLPTLLSQSLQSFLTPIPGGSVGRFRASPTPGNKAIQSGTPC